MCFSMVVEADGGGVRAAGANDGEGIAGFLSRYEEAGRAEGAGDVDDLARQGGELVGAVWGSGGTGERGYGAFRLAVCRHDVCERMREKTKIL